jgi:hypothetical protein
VDEAAEQRQGRDYDAGKLLDTLLDSLRLKNDAALSRLLEVAPPVISKVRHRKMPMSGSLLIRMHEVSGLPIIDLRYLMGDRRSKFRMSDVQGRPKIAAVPSASWLAPLQTAWID